MSSALGPPDARGGGVGVIYVLTDADRRLSKIGRTAAGTAAGRALSYGKLHGHRWTVFAQMATLRVAEVEANIHAVFETKRVRTSTNAREIFRIRPADAEVAARALILPPGGTAEVQREAIRCHVRRVRSRLKAQEEFLDARRLRSSIPSLSTVIETEIYPQYLVLDALERGISVDAMLSIYRHMQSRRTTEQQRIEAAYRSKWDAMWKSTSWWSRLWSGTPYVAKEEINSNLFPSIPYYAAEILTSKERAAMRRVSKPAQ